MISGISTAPGHLARGINGSSQCLPLLRSCHSFRRSVGCTRRRSTGIACSNRGSLLPPTCRWAEHTGSRRERSRSLWGQEGRRCSQLPEACKSKRVLNHPSTAHAAGYRPAAAATNCLAAVLPASMHSPSQFSAWQDRSKHLESSECGVATRFRATVTRQGRIAEGWQAGTHSIHGYWEIARRHADSLWPTGQHSAPVHRSVGWEAGGMRMPDEGTAEGM